MTIRDSAILFIATGGWTGRSPKAPGTVGTLAGIPFVLVFSVIPAAFSGVYVTALVLAAVFVADQAEKLIGRKDPGCIVIDEIAGYVITMSVVPVQISTLVAGFLIFRFFDIVKPAPVKYFETRFTGGAAVVLDDVMAGVLSAFVLWVLCLWL